MIVKIENQSERKFLPMCGTKADSGKVERKAYMLSQTRNVAAGTERRGEAEQEQGNKRSSWLLFCLVTSVLCFPLPFPLTKFGQR